MSPGSTLPCHIVDSSREHMDRTHGGQEAETDKQKDMTPSSQYAEAPIRLGFLKFSANPMIAHPLKLGFIV